MKQFICLIAFALCLSFNSHAQIGMSNCMANPNPLIFAQEDGTNLNVHLVGNMNLHYMLSEDGYTLLYNAKGGIEYAVQQGDNLIPSGVLAHNDATRNIKELSFLSGITKHLTYGDSKIQSANSMNKQMPNKPGTSSGPTYDIAKRFPSSGTKRVLVILIKFKDYDSTYSKGSFINMLSQKNYNGTGSFVDYMNKNSFGTLNLKVDVFGWYTSKDSIATYGYANGNTAATKLVAEAVDAAHAAGVDFSKYDNDGDGNVDGVVVMHAGPGAEQNLNGKYIWSHYYDLANVGLSRYYNNVTISHYTIQPELLYSSLIGIGVLCHEFGHLMGMPDLYNTNYVNGDYASAGVGDYDVMGGGSWLNNTATPSSFSAWSKSWFKWVTPVTINTAGAYTIAPSANHKNIYKIKTSVANEYYLLENRYANGFDSSLPCHGLAIWHIDSKIMDITNMVWYYYNAVESDLTDVGVYLEQADGRYDLDKAASSGGNRGDGGDLFPGNTSNTTFNDKTTPNALTWSGKKSGVSIQKITQNTDSTISFNFGPYPSASFSAMYSAICSNTSLTLTNTSVYTTSYAWNFGDSTAIDTNFSPTHTFKKAGNYTIKLLAKSSTGTDSTTMPLTVYALPGSAFTLTGVNGPTATVQNTTPSSSGGNFYTWNWGDGNTNFKSTRTVTHTFKDTGLYVVELNTINNITQCSDTFKSAIHVASLTGIAGMYQNKYMLEAYPNPFANVLNFSLTLDKPAILEVAIYNLSGQKLMTLKNGSFSSGLNAFKLESISSLAAGVYFIGVSAEGQMPSMMKIIKN